VPVPRPYAVEPMRWSALTGDDLRLVGGYFLGPTDDPRHPDDNRAVFTPTPRPTTALLAAAAGGNSVPAIGRQQLREFRADLAYWNAAVIVLAPTAQEESLWKAISALVGKAPIWLDGVWLWDVRDLR